MAKKKKTPKVRVTKILNPLSKKPKGGMANMFDVRLDIGITTKMNDKDYKALMKALGMKNNDKEIPRVDFKALDKLVALSERPLHVKTWNYGQMGSSMDVVRFINAEITIVG